MEWATFGMLALILGILLAGVLCVWVGLNVDRLLGRPRRVTFPHPPHCGDETCASCRSYAAATREYVATRHTS